MNRMPRLHHAVVRRTTAANLPSRPFLLVSGFRIDYLDRPTNRRFVIVRPQYKPPSLSRSPTPASSSRHSSVPEDRSRSPSPDLEQVDEPSIADVKTESRSRSPTPPLLTPIKERRSTDRSEISPELDLVPIAGRTFYSPVGSYLSTKDTVHIHRMPDLMLLCEQLNLAATTNSTALATVYPVQFVLKSNAYDARLHFLAGSPTLASVLLGQPGDLVAAKTELKITQRLRLDQHKLGDLERKFYTNVENALITAAQLPYAQPLLTVRSQLTAPNHTKFAILIASAKAHVALDSLNPATQPSPSNGTLKNEAATPPRGVAPNDNIPFKKERIDHDDDEASLSRLIQYLSGSVAPPPPPPISCFRFLGKKQPV